MEIAHLSLFALCCCDKHDQNNSEKKGFIWFPNPSLGTQGWNSSRSWSRNHGTTVLLLAFSFPCVQLLFWPFPAHLSGDGQYPQWPEPSHIKEQGGWEQMPRRPIQWWQFLNCITHLFKGSGLRQVLAETTWKNSVLSLFLQNAVLSSTWRHGTMDSRSSKNSSTGGWHHAK